MVRERLSEDALRWLKSNGIDISEVIDMSWPSSGTFVSQVNQSDGERCFLKQFKCSDKFARAVNAYENWLVDFEVSVPRLISVDRPGLRFLMSDVGDCSTWENLSPDQQERIQFEAGKFLKKLHKVEFEDNDQTPLGEAVLRRAQATYKRMLELQAAGSQEYFGGTSVEEVANIVSGVEEVLPLLNLCKRVPCHRDFWRRNWIWPRNEGKTCDEVSFRVIDFEHARPDLFLFDMMKNWSDCWLESAGLESAFWDGYGRMLDDQERLLLHRCGALHAIQTILWANEHQQTELLSQGQALLAAINRR